MSHPEPTIWSWDQMTLIRGPGIPERDFSYTLPGKGIYHAKARLMLHGVRIKEIKVIEAAPPCIFCNSFHPRRNPEQDLILARIGANACRPLCHACKEKQTCIQAVVQAYLPTCLHCFFEGKIYRRRPGVIFVDVNPMLCATEEFIAEALMRQEQQELVERLG